MPPINSARGVAPPGPAHEGICEEDSPTIHSAETIAEIRYVDELVHRVVYYVLWGGSQRDS